jgi:alkylhydroperoxidase/carboxymuconolactone decarboxylase family protein YurZ
MCGSVSSSDKISAAREVRRKFLGEKFVAAADRYPSGDPMHEYYSMALEHIWGGSWSRPGLDQRTRSAITIALLTSIHWTEGIGNHVRAALQNQLLSREEITEIILHTANYIGYPFVQNAMQAARDAMINFDADANK